MKKNTVLSLNKRATVQHERKKCLVRIIGCSAALAQPQEKGKKIIPIGGFLGLGQQLRVGRAGVQKASGSLAHSEQSIL